MSMYASCQYFNPRWLPTTQDLDLSDPNANGVLPSDGTAVSSLIDKSRKGNNASQGTGANQPLFKLNITQGRPGLLFDGSNDFMNTALASALLINSSPYEIYIVAKSSSATVQFLAACATSGKYEIDINAGVGCSFIPTAGGTDIGTASQYTDGNPHIFCGRVESDVNQTSYVQVDGVDGGTPVTLGQSTATTTTRIGYRGNNTFPLAGYIFEKIVCNAQLTAVQRTLLRNYLKNKWGTS